MLFNKKSEIDKVIEKYSLKKGQEFLVYFYTYLEHSRFYSEKNKMPVSEVAQAALNYILNQHDENYVDEYMIFFKEAVCNKKLIEELSKAGLKYFDLSFEPEKVPIKQVAPVIMQDQSALARDNKPQETAGVPHRLGRDEDKHIFCEYEGREDDCPRECLKCAIYIKTLGDEALAEGRNDVAIKNYKKAIFIEPKFAEAWTNLANAYGMQSEYNNALQAFDKAISIDPIYGKALFGKAITLRNLGREEEAVDLANHILEMYADEDVLRFRNSLIGSDSTIPSATDYSKDRNDFHPEDAQSNIKVCVAVEEQPKRALFCRKCGTKLLEDSDFCHKCGTKII